jgi:hypothetical protein
MSLPAACEGKVVCCWNGAIMLLQCWCSQSGARLLLEWCDRVVTVATDVVTEVLRDGGLFRQNDTRSMAQSKHTEW